MAMSSASILSWLTYRALCPFPLIFNNLS